ncbi:PREDICTED: desiccation-related protein At2g46140-like isoform X1 [Brassica oleracea var. oleracea]|uniref:Water stress and hypersensitive response domain-containing protein n=1 Tax=Brassica oleracea var. oleracea TaxID=109376 RepID=A0A0D3C6J3_BRAOL|nr:PREDICTED: desiccation-related protein At2g46140-like isoform X1 [Brassica oleracea var. oleracea]
MAETEQKEVEETGSLISGLLDKAKGFFAEKLANIPTPEATVDDVDFKGVTRQGVDYHAKVSVKNPYPQHIPICQISYILKSDTRMIASGTIPDPGSLIANGSTVLDVPVKVPYSIAVSLMKDMCLDWDIDYQLDIGLTIDIPIVGDITIPVSTQGEMKLPSLRDFF